MFEVVAGRYVLIDSIGSGGAGEVWRAFDRKTGSYCAAKVIRHPEAATLVRAVYEQGVRLDHPHVVTPYSWTADDEQVLLAMPLVRGGSLAVLLRDLGVLPPRYAAEVLRQLLVALDHVHAAGLVHRDVKPANLLLEPTGTGAPHARLADFGLVLTPDRPRITATFTVVGTRAYLAPESLEYGDQGAAQDLYAAGLVGTEMVGAETVGTQTPGAVGPPVGLLGLLGALTASDPTRRPGSASEALERLTEILDGWPLETPALIPGSDEPVEVFEQIGALPDGWGPTGPIAEAETAKVVRFGDSTAATTARFDPAATMHIELGPVVRFDPEATVRVEPGPAVPFDPGATMRVDRQVDGMDWLWSPEPVEPPGAGARGSAAFSAPDYGQPRNPMPSNESAAKRTQPPPLDAARSGWQPLAQPQLPLPGSASGDRHPFPQPQPPLPGTARSDRQPSPRSQPLPPLSGTARGDYQPFPQPPPTVPYTVRGPRRPFPPHSAEPDIDRVRLIPVTATPSPDTALTTGLTAAPPVSRRRRWRLATVLGAVLVLASVIGAVAVALH